MKTFKDLMQEERHSTYEPYLNHIPADPETDLIVRKYNNLWGMLTDSHMTSFKNGYLITGSICAQEDKFLTLLCCTTWGGAKLGPNSFYRYMTDLGYEGSFTTINNDICYFFSQKTDHEFADPRSVASLTTNESKIPVKIDMSEFKGSKDIVKDINESKNFPGEWAYIKLQDGEYLISESNGLIKKLQIK